jgi:hypothetical protein
MKIVATGLAICLATPLVAQDNAEIQFVKRVFAQLQPLSFKENREFCGYIGYDAAGDLMASNAARGDESSCLADDPPAEMEIIASYHTHGAASEEHYGEIPSGADTEGDEEEGIDGWVATPGGRLWYNDSTDMVASQICSVGCLEQDPNFFVGIDGQIAQSYSYDDLVERISQ